MTLSWNDLLNRFENRAQFGARAQYLGGVEEEQ